MSTFRPGPVWREVSECARSHTGRRLGKVLLGAAILGIGVKLYRRYKRNQRRQEWNKAGKDVVVLHQFERTRTSPNMSPFPHKVETFLRMANIKYVVDTEEPLGPKHKSPWITFNGQELSDSELIIDFLMKYFRNPVSENLTPAEHAVGRAVQVMLDEHAAHAVFYKRYVLDNCEYVIKVFPTSMRHLFWLLKLFPGEFRKYFSTIGIGRFNNDETMFFLYRDLKAVEDILGEKQYLLGNTPTTYDAAVFAELTQVLCNCAPKVERYVRENHGKLAQHHDRMKEKFWPDWEQCRSE